MDIICMCCSRTVERTDHDSAADDNMIPQMIPTADNTNNTDKATTTMFLDSGQSTVVAQSAWPSLPFRG